MKINVFDIIKNKLITKDEFCNMFQQALYNNYQLLLPFGDNCITKYDSTKTYSEGDFVYTYKIGTNGVYKSLLSNNTEPLNNTNAWEEVENKYLTPQELGSIYSMAVDIIPASIKDVYADTEDEEMMNKLKYIIGLFIACYIANKVGVFDGAGGGLKQCTSQSIDGLQASFSVPSYLLDEKNMFYTGNPFGLELLSLRNKLFVGKYGDTIPSMDNDWWF